MSDKNDKNLDKNEEIEQTLDELSELAELDDPNVEDLRTKISNLKSGIEVLQGTHLTEDNVDPSDNDPDEDDEEIPLTTKELKQLYRLVNKVKHVDDETINEITDEERDRMIRVAGVMFEHLTYQPKKRFGVEYKKKRQRKNHLAKQSRKRNRV